MSEKLPWWFCMRGPSKFTPPKTNDAAVTIKKIVFASSMAIEALQSYVDEVLEAISDATGEKGIKHAFVSDRSMVSDFLPGDPTGEERQEINPFSGKPMRVVVVERDTPKNRLILAAISDTLGVMVEMDDYIYEIAKRVRDK